MTLQPTLCCCSVNRR